MKKMNMINCRIIMILYPIIVYPIISWVIKKVFDTNTSNFPPFYLNYFFEIIIFSIFSFILVQDKLDLIFISIGISLSCVIGPMILFPNDYFQDSSFTKFVMLAASNLLFSITDIIIPLFISIIKLYLIRKK